MKWRHLVLLSFVALPGCQHAANRLPVAEPQVQTAGEALQQVRARRPERFKMLHQVAAHYDGKSYVMSGYLLGRSDGSFRVSASAPIGPRLFDVGRLQGQWQARVHLKQLSETRLNPKHMAQAIERIYFTGCEGEGERRGPDFFYSCQVEGDEEADRLELVLDGRTLAPLSKRFTQDGQMRVEILYLDPEAFGQEWQARKIQLRHHGGLKLDVALVGYQPGFNFEDALLSVED